MTEAVAVTGAALAWLGVTLLTVADGRRGLALALALATAGLTLAAAVNGPPSGAVPLAVGGLAAAALLLRSGPPGWAIMPPGSTPRLVTAIVVVIGAALVAGSELGSPAGTARLAALLVAVLAGLRVLTVGQRAAALAAGSALSLGLGALGGPVALVAGALAAAALAAAGGGAEPAGRVG